MVSIKDLADANSPLSSTRWAFAAVVKADIAMIFITLVAGIIGHFVGKPLEKSFYEWVVKAAGTLTGILALAKAAQGFEPRERKRS